MKEPEGEEHTIVTVENPAAVATEETPFTYEPKVHTLYRTVLNYITHCDCEFFSCSQKFVHLYNAWTWKMYLVN